MIAAQPGGGSNYLYQVEMAYDCFKALERVRMGEVIARKKREPPRANRVVI